MQGTHTCNQVVVVGAGKHSPIRPSGFAALEIDKWLFRAPRCTARPVPRNAGNGPRNGKQAPEKGGLKWPPKRVRRSQGVSQIGHFHVVTIARQQNDATLASHASQRIPGPPRAATCATTDRHIGISPIYEFVVTLMQHPILDAVIWQRGYSHEQPNIAVVAELIFQLRQTKPAPFPLRFLPLCVTRNWRSLVAF